MSARAQIRAVIIDGVLDDATLAVIRDALAQPHLCVVFAKPTIAQVIQQVSHEMGVPIVTIRGEARSVQGLRARYAIAWLAYRVTGKGAASIGLAINRDENTVFTAIRRGEEMRGSDVAFRDLTDRLHEHFTGERP